MVFRKPQPRIYDTFIFGDELDILECRLTEYAGTDIYRHVIVEADVDHQGHPKPFNFLEHKDRFAPFLDRITYIQMNDLGEKIPGTNVSDNWKRIYAQRDALARGLRDLRKDDIILFGDADEIMQPEGIAQTLECAAWVDGIRFYQRHVMFCVDWEETYMPWHGPVAVTYKNAPKKVHSIRDYGTSGHTYYGAGFHLSWLGGPDVIRRKTTQYCHPEIDNYILVNLDNGRLLEKGFYWGANTYEVQERQLTPVQVDSEWPKWIAERRCPENWFREFHAGTVDTQDIRGRVETNLRH